jgi:ABC-type uncharacterized transport system permease subunit
MISAALLSCIATFFMLPGALLPWFGEARSGWPFWRNLLIALLWAQFMTWHLMWGQWSAALTADLWVTICATLTLFGLTALFNRQAWRLGVLMMPYLILLAILGSFAASHGAIAVSGYAPSAWIDLHILVSVTTLGLLTLAAAAALACFIQSRALKNKTPNRLSRQLPSVSDSEKLYERLLMLSEAVLAAGVASGMATQFAETGRLLVFDHKTLFSLLAFVLIGGLIAGRRWGGVRGQMAVRLLLMAYSFVLLGYFGVKFVKQVLLS